MEIRNFHPDDYEQVCGLLVECGVEPPAELSDLNGPCLVAVKDCLIIGVLFALTGTSSRAYLDYLAIRDTARCGFVYHRLLTAMDKILKDSGVKRYIFHIEKHNHNAHKQLYKYREQFGIRMLRDMHYFSREIP